MRFPRFLVVAGVLTLALGGCLRNGDNGPVAPQSQDPSLAPSQDGNVVLRGDVGDFVWHDMNDNGLQDDGPLSGVNGVDIVIECIRELDGSLWTMTFTTSNDPATGLAGWYNFNSVPAGSCVAYVVPATIPAGLRLGDHPCGGPIEFYIGVGPVGNNNKNIDFCLVDDVPPPVPGEIGDFVWCDVNDDGVQDFGEPGIAGIVVDLVCADGSSASTVTDANGYYLFTDVATGVACTVSLDPLSFPSDKSPGSHCPTTRTLTLADGESNLDQDFCFVNNPPVIPCCLTGKRPDAITFMYVAQDCSFSNNSQSSGSTSCNDYGPLPNTAYIMVTDKSQLGHRNEKIYFEGTVNLGENWTMSKDFAGAKKIPGDTRIWVLDAQGGNILQFARLHTSCSEPLISGEQYGAHVLVSCE